MSAVVRVHSVAASSAAPSGLSHYTRSRSNLKEVQST